MSRLRQAIALLAAAGLSMIATAALSGSEQQAAARPRASRAGATVAISLGTNGTRIPTSFFGLSTEYSELPIYERQLPAFERILRQLHLGNDGPMFLRVGGDSADLTYWNPGSQQLPADAFVLTPAWFQQTNELVSQLGLRVTLDLNLKAHSTSMAAALVSAGLTRLPSGSLAGLEIGNEPDRYKNYSIPSYERDFRSYANALVPVAPGLPLLGPAITSTSTNYNWLAGVITGIHAQLGVLTGHRYPLDACAKPGASGYPTIAKLLGEGLTAGMAQSVAPAVRLAHRAHRPFFLDEMNSVTCTGKVGVSNTFATALWAPDALFEILGTGADKANVHIRPTTINGPIVVSAGGLRARPLLYGLILFARTVGSGRQLVRLNINAPSSTHLKAWAVRQPGNGVNVLLINKGSKSTTVDLRLPASGTASLQRLLAPSAGATSGVTLAGQQLALDASWAGSEVLDSIHPGPAGYHVTMPALSAALITIG